MQKMNDASLQSLGLKFVFISEKQKLIIQAYCPKQNLSYIGQIAAHPLIDFQDIKQLLIDGQFKTLIKNQNLLKVKVGAVPIELISKSQSQIQDLKKELKKSSQKQQQQDAIIKQQTNKINDHQCIISELQMTVNQLKKALQSVIGDLKIYNNDSIAFSTETKSNIQEFKSRLNKLQNPFDLIPMDLPIQQIKWSQQLKLKTVEINGNIAKSTEISKFPQFCLLDVGFQRLVNRRQCWGIRIKKKTSTFYLGVCLKKVMQKNNFIFKNFKWQEIGHGCYLIGSNGYCYNDSLKQLNNVIKSFRFEEGDVIFVQYDPLKRCLRFRKNEKGLRFQMPINDPPEDDAYHPCVDFYNENTEAELILPGIPLT